MRLIPPYLLPLPAFRDSWNSLERGRWGERAVERLLWREGFRIRERCWQATSRSDIDLIAANDDLLLFCEVKVRSEGDPNPWGEILEEKRQRHLLDAAAEYLHRTDQVYVRIRFDAFLLRPDPAAPRRPTIERDTGYLKPEFVPGWRGPA